jgi:hypothetical protein
MRPLRMLTAGALSVGTVLAGVGVVQADDAPPPDAPPPVAAATSNFTLPLFGTPLLIDVTTDAGGGLLEIALNPSDAYTATKVKPNHVGFVNTDGTVKVRVSAKHGGERISLRAGEPTDLTGPGSWSGDVFGTGQTTTVDFTTGIAGDGGPDITLVTVSSAVESTVGATEYSTHEDDDDDDGHESEQSASATVTFTEAGQTRTLKIRFTVETEDGVTRSSLKIGLSRIRGQQIADGPAVGPHTWSGMLCAGPATVTYTVADDGTISDVVPSPDASVSNGEHGVSVEFSRGERIRISVKGDAPDLVVGVSSKIRCDKTDPKVNTTVDPAADDHHDGDDDHDGDHDEDHDSDHDEDHDKSHGEDHDKSHDDRGDSHDGDHD